MLSLYGDQVACQELFSEGMTLLINPRGLCKSPMVACQRLHIALFSSVPHMSSIMGTARLYGPKKTHTCTA